MREHTDYHVKQLIDRAQSFYMQPGETGALPYHNWKHAVDVCRYADELADLAAKKHGAQVDRSLLLIASAWHDAGYHEPLVGYPSKEHRSAAYADSALTELNDEQKKVVTSAILDTMVGKHPKDSEHGIALHFADIGYMADANYDIFFEHISAMREEWGRPDWKTAIARTVQFAELLSQEAETELSQVLLPRDVKSWIERLQSNMSRLASGGR